MADSTFWNRMGFDGASAIGLGGVDTRPYTVLSKGASAMAQKVLDDAAAIFPEFDGVSNVALPLPADFAAPSFGSFLNWHTAHQVQFLKERAPNWTAGDLRAVTFGTSANPVENETFVLSADGRRAIHVNQLQTIDLAQLPLEDQRRLAEDIPAFRAIHANPLGLWPADGVSGSAPPTTVAAARDRIETLYLAELERAVQSSANYRPERRAEAVTAANLQTHYPNMFLDQIDLMRRRLAKMAIFNPDAIGQFVADLKERFERLERYATTTRPTLNSFGLIEAANSTDDLASLDRAKLIFMQMELRLRDVAASSADIAFTGNFIGRAVDTPLMVFLFQTQENSSAEADARARSEELNQMNALIQAYTRIQQFVNDTLKRFDPVAFQAANPNDDKAIERKALLGKNSLSDLNLSSSDLRALSMFETSLAKLNQNSFHPIELATNAVRPTFDIIVMPSPFIPFVGLKQHTQQEWDLFSQSLSKVSKVLSSDSQARMDEVNRISRGKNRSYELASETLNKMTDILRSIVN